MSNRHVVTMSQRLEPDLARVAGMIGEPARAAMLTALLGGQPLNAGELARRARVAPATASAHLARLVENGLLTVRRAGRHRYYALASAEVAAVLETLARIAAPIETNGRSRSTGAGAGNGNTSVENGSLRFARTCYDHLAGRLGILLTDTLLQRGIITGAAFELTAEGDEWLRGLNIDAQALRESRRKLTRPCLDWSERREHLAGAVGAALANTLLERRWLVRLEGTRAVRLTLRGREGLYRSLGIQVAD